MMLMRCGPFPTDSYNLQGWPGPQAALGSPAVTSLGGQHRRGWVGSLWGHRMALEQVTPCLKFFCPGFEEGVGQRGCEEGQENSRGGVSRPRAWGRLLL